MSSARDELHGTDLAAAVNSYFLPKSYWPDGPQNSRENYLNVWNGFQY